MWVQGVSRHTAGMHVWFVYMPAHMAIRPPHTGSSLCFHLCLHASPVPNPYPYQQSKGGTQPTGLHMSVPCQVDTDASPPPFDVDNSPGAHRHLTNLTTASLGKVAQRPECSTHAFWVCVFSARSVHAAMHPPYSVSNALYLHTHTHTHTVEHNATHACTRMHALAWHGTSKERSLVSGGSGS